MAAARIVVTTLAVVLLGATLAQGAGDVEQQVSRVIQQWAELLNGGDAQGFADLHTEDALVRHSNGVYNDGRESIQAWAQGAFSNGLRFEADTTEAGPLGESVAFGRGTWAASSEAGELLLNGEWFAVYNRSDGEWKIFRLFSGSLPLPEEGG